MKSKILNILVCSFGLISLLLYVVGGVSFLSLIEYNDIALIIPIFAAFLPLMTFFSLLEKIHLHENIKYAYYSNQAIIALAADYGLFKILLHFNTPEILCWILAVVLFIGIMSFHSMAPYITDPRDSKDIF